MRLTANTFDTDIKHCQTIVLSVSPKRDFDKSINVFTLLRPINLYRLMARDYAELMKMTQLSKSAAQADQPGSTRPIPAQ